MMHICTSTAAVPPSPAICGPSLPPGGRSTKLLGVLVDDQLSWKEHASTIISSASYKIYMLHRLRSLGAPADALRGVYLTFILPKLMYASPAWSSSLNLTQRQQLERVQKRAFRIILEPAYGDALTCLSLPRLATRHQEALEKFGERAAASSTSPPPATLRRASPCPRHPTPKSRGALKSTAH
ncbi:hypothetical protein E2C01_060980 [Portunus trituberculatus]|uniref:RNA-directed DNA polymerase from mobile element jockey n=1 Tax=Portunus trituberculatus TaxID=210409 RepID=A0A5B7HA55_PORTR|nr:hypothetical protein [Portunus trituberculatus]